LVITGNLSDAETLVLLDLLNFQTRTEVVESREDQLTAAVARLRDLRLKYTDAHPLVVEQLEIIEQLKNP
jgi:rRNA maturation protein Rpf1